VSLFYEGRIFAVLELGPAPLHLPCLGVDVPIKVGLRGMWRQALQPNLTLT